MKYAASLNIGVVLPFRRSDNWVIWRWIIMSLKKTLKKCCCHAGSYWVNWRKKRRLPPKRLRHKILKILQLLWDVQLFLSGDRCNHFFPWDKPILNTDFKGPIIYFIESRSLCQDFKIISTGGFSYSKIVLEGSAPIKSLTRLLS